jgi:hypothetical protein
MAFNHDRQRLAPPWIPPATGRANRSRRVILVDRRKVFDTDAAAYIAAVEAADGQALETGVRNAINAFVVGCKADGIWSAIKASCILAGARTLTGALVPLVGTAPTNVNFVSGDYNRETGLLGNGSSKYLNTNRNNNADPQNNRHQSVFISVAPSATGIHMGTTTAATPGSSQIASDTSNGNSNFSLSNTATAAVASTASSLGFRGASRSASGSITARVNGSNNTLSLTSNAPANSSIFLFCRDGTAVFSNARISFYSIGESLALATLNSRVTTLIDAIAAAIP